MQNRVNIYLSLSALVILFFLLDILTGEINIPAKEIYHILFSQSYNKSEWTAIILQYRLPKALTAVLAGIALPAAGLQMQTLFRNPLAGPYVLGISQGATLGAAIAVLGLPSVFSLNGIGSGLPLVLSAWAGSFIMLLLIMILSLRLKNIYTLLIIGLLLGYASSAIIDVLQLYSSETMLKSFVIWSMGSISNTGYGSLAILAPSVIAGLLLCWLMIKPLNILQMGETYAVTAGVAITQTRLIIFLSVSMLAASVTAFCGPIGFTGLVVPHIGRLIIKSADHRHLLFVSILTGTIMMLVSDMATNLPLTHAVLPVNTVTSLFGIPVLIWILFKKPGIQQ